MPFDALPGIPRRPHDRLTGLAELAWLLRNPHRWPEGFEWDYDYLDHCGIGLCDQAFGLLIVRSPPTTWPQFVAIVPMLFRRWRIAHPEGRPTRSIHNRLNSPIRATWRPVSTPLRQ
jgi:hypothetical protein